MQSWASTRSRSDGGVSVLLEAAFLGEASISTRRRRMNSVHPEMPLRNGFHKVLCVIPTGGEVKRLEKIVKLCFQFVNIYLGLGIVGGYVGYLRTLEFANTSSGPHRTSPNPTETSSAPNPRNRRPTARRWRITRAGPGRNGTVLYATVLGAWTLGVPMKQPH